MKGEVKFGIICDLGVTFNNDWRIFGVRFTRIPPWMSSRFFITSAMVL